MWGFFYSQQNNREKMIPAPILSIIHTVAKDAMLNFNDGNNGQGLKNVLCKHNSNEVKWVCLAYEIFIFRDFLYLSQNYRKKFSFGARISHDCQCFSVLQRTLLCNSCSVFLTWTNREITPKLAVNTRKITPNRGAFCSFII